jgi:holo-[acyl-carrier protein] synthase
MTVRIGIDIQAIEDVEESLIRFASRYTNRLFTDSELQECDLTSSLAPRRLAERFAAKEATIKVLGPTNAIPDWKSIEIRTTPSGHPIIALSGFATDLAALRGLGSLSLTTCHARGIVTAVVVADVISQGPMVLS